MSEAQGSLVRQEEQLSEAQEAALAAMKGGQTFVRAAEEARVSRMTVYRWLRGDPHFRAAYNAWQQEATESARARLVKLADKAVDVVDWALDHNDEKVALKMLRGMGALCKRRRGSTSAQVLRLQMELGEKRELRQAEMAMLEHLLEKTGMPAEQRKRVLSGGRAAGVLLGQVRRQSAGREEEAEDQPAAGPVTPKKSGPQETGEGAWGEQLRNLIENSNLEMDFLESPE